MDKKYRAARVWSNRELKKYAHEFSGSVINVSAWKDEDKEGDKYQSYFKNASEYSITNYGGHMGVSGGVEIPEYSLDLSIAIPIDMKQKFDVVFNHTTLEHIYENRIAFKNLCDLGKEAVIVVVPWVQQVHIVEGGFCDYWRYSPFAMELLFEENGYNLVICTYNDNLNTSVYLFCIGIRKEVMEKYPQFKKIALNNVEPAGGWVGRSFVRKCIDNIKTLMK